MTHNRDVRAPRGSERPGGPAGGPDACPTCAVRVPSASHPAGERGRPGIRPDRPNTPVRRDDPRRHGPQIHDPRRFGGAAPEAPLLRRLIGSVLRRIRQAQGRTLRDVAEAAQVSMPYLSEVERGVKEASSEVLAAICRALGIRLVDLLAEVMAELGRQEPAVAPTRRVVQPAVPSPTSDPAPAEVVPAEVRAEAGVPDATLAAAPAAGEAELSVRLPLTVRTSASLSVPSLSSSSSFSPSAPPTIGFTAARVVVAAGRFQGTRGVGRSRRVTRSAVTRSATTRSTATRPTGRPAGRVVALPMLTAGHGPHHRPVFVRLAG